MLASWVGIQKSSQMMSNLEWIINPTTDQLLYYFQLEWTHYFYSCLVFGFFWVLEKRHWDLKRCKIFESILDPLVWQCCRRLLHCRFRMGNRCFEHKNAQFTNSLVISLQCTQATTTMVEIYQQHPTNHGPLQQPTKPPSPMRHDTRVGRRQLISSRMAKSHAMIDEMSRSFQVIKFLQATGAAGTFFLVVNSGLEQIDYE